MYGFHFCKTHAYLPRHLIKLKSILCLYFLFFVLRVICASLSFSLCLYLCLFYKRAILVHLCVHHNVPHDGDSYLTSHFQICLQAVFVPQPESVDDTSYFLSRFSQISSGLLDDQNGSYSDADTCDSSSNSRTEVNYQLTS